MYIDCIYLFLYIRWVNLVFTDLMWLVSMAEKMKDRIPLFYLVDMKMTRCIHVHVFRLYHMYVHVCTCTPTVFTVRWVTCMFYVYVHVCTCVYMYVHVCTCTPTVFTVCWVTCMFYVYVHVFRLYFTCTYIYIFYLCTCIYFILYMYMYTYCIYSVFDYM